MEKLNHAEVVSLLIQLSLMLGVGRLMAELFRVFKQPAVVGEIIAGIILGPTILGAISPEAFQWLFPSSGPTSIALDGFIQMSVILLLFIAGMEVELHIVWQQGKQALLTSLFALTVPFIIGFLVTYYFPDFFSLSSDSEQRLVFALFIGTTMAITALPVIARILMDLSLFKSGMGMLIIASAMINDLLGWLIFTVILSMMGNSAGMAVWQTILLTIGFTLGMLTLGKGLINKGLPWINKKMSWPGGVLSIAMAFCLLAAAFTEFIGIHAIFGAFIIGVAVGDSQHLTERAKEILHHFINSIFAPLFFVSIGLHINFVSSFNLPLVVVLIVLAFVGKVSGAYFGARSGGLERPQALAVGFGMNTHGTLEVILGAIALEAGLISDEIFVAILVMVILTIVTSAPLMKYCLQWQERTDAMSKASAERSPNPK
ncbi:Kef-type K+ transport system membrane component KefB [Catalinimonas alkaloidigena]|uniref:cation:proton antiporter n=1 Tax=Catalinimonas alkaloidigena TaxID=1075417 RepID=UPI002406BFAA|nr:cation:proton antiporter [Catalinimonas alkaloidigena]MDF9795491.1 Kef-type K+ transport system membrane component KefB [Catalinimonas alkaloidigena]